ncbi:unnamed protein product [Ambrosiozyma monospora]|uniref:Unnamed protein product n=1 Tax=Ambrosiozyma monospora TaxID=43982 RepID=A0ACB5T6G3_AMBMO|nr:unnamed protein product [Ambrosiozyma monospora]
MKFSAKAQASSPSSLSSTPDESIYKFRNKNFTQLSMFKTGHGLDFKIMYHALELNICATASTIIMQDNLSHFTNDYSASMDPLNISVANVLYNLQIDNLRNFLGIYKDFGLISLFKFFQKSMLQDLRLIPCYSQALSDLIIFDSNDFSHSNSSSSSSGNSSSNSGSDSNSSSSNSSTTTTQQSIILETIQQSNILSNLLRQIVELFDDGKTASFKRMVNYLKKNPSPIKPSKIEKGTAMLDLNKFAKVLGYRDKSVFFTR